MHAGPRSDCRVLQAIPDPSLIDSWPEAEGDVTHRSSRLSANVLCLAAATGIVGLSRFSTNWLVADAYGPAEHGRFAVVFQFISMLLVIAELGMVSTYGVRQISLATLRDRATLGSLVNNLSGVLLAVHLLAAAALLVLAEPVGRWLGADGHLLRLAAIWLVGFGLYRLTMMVANGLEAMAYSAATTLLFYALWMCWLAACLSRQLPLQSLFAGWAVGLPIAAAVCWLLMRPLLHRYDLRWRPRFTNLRQATTTIAASLPYSLPLTGTLILPGVACVLLVRLNGSLEQVSYFQICFSVGILANLAAVPTAGAILPTLSCLIASDPADGLDRARTLVRRGVTMISAVVTLPLAIFIWFGSQILSLIGDAYGPHAPVLLLIAGAVVLDAFRMVVDQLLMASRHVRAVAWAETGRFAVLIAVAWMVVPEWGALGAAVALLLSTLVNFLTKLIMARRLMGLNLWLEGTGLAAGLAVMAAVTPLGGPPWLALAIWGIGVTCVTLMSLRDRSPSRE